MTIDAAPRVSDSEPFFLPGSTTGCLLLHGFTASPDEMRFLGERLHTFGNTVSGPRVAGHGTSIDEFARTTWRDWSQSAHAALVGLRAQTTSVTVVGQSMGALLGLQLAAEYPGEVQSLALLAPALRLSRWWLPWIRPVLPPLARRGRVMQKHGSDIADAAARAARCDYRQIPLSALHEFLVLQQRARRLLQRVHQPTLVIQSRQDHTCSMRGVALLQSRLSGPVQTMILDDSYHVVSVDVDRERVAQRIAAFVAETAGAAS